MGKNTTLLLQNIGIYWTHFLILVCFGGLLRRASITTLFLTSGLDSHGKLSMVLMGNVVVTVVVGMIGGVALDRNVLTGGGLSWELEDVGLVVGSVVGNLKI